MPDHEKMAIRLAMLDAQSEWLDGAEAAETITGRTIAVVIADAFEREAEKYKTKETKFYDLDGGTLINSGSAWDDERSGTTEVPAAGTEGGSGRHAAESADS